MPWQRITAEQVRRGDRISSAPNGATVTVTTGAQPSVAPGRVRLQLAGERPISPLATQPFWKET